MENSNVDITADQYSTRLYQNQQTTDKSSITRATFSYLNTYHQSEKNPVSHQLSSA
jgi:hypothetical protein